MATITAGMVCRRKPVPLGHCLFRRSREDLRWTLKEIVDGGGKGSISEARFVEGLVEEQIIAYQAARRSDDSTITQEATLLLTEWSSGGVDPHDPEMERPAAVFKFVDAATHSPNPMDIRFDVFEGGFTRTGDRRAFDHSETEGLDAMAIR
ncbi:MAG: hypothetical protein PVH30_01695 [Desulfobacterales bacterium]